MEIINVHSYESRIEILKQFNLNPSFDVSKIDSTLSRFVYNKCQHLIPYKIIELFHRKGMLEKFIKDIELHLEFKFTMSNFIEEHKNKFVENNIGYLKNFLTQMKELEEDYEYTGSVSNYINKHLNTMIRREFGLGTIELENKGYHPKSNDTVEHVTVPEYLAPFIFFMTINNDINSSIKKNKVDSLIYLSKKTKTYLNLISTYKGLQRQVCLYNFENHYNLGLYKQTMKYLGKFSEKNRTDIAKVLGLAALLPNIKGRLDYIQVLAESRSLMNRDLEDFENGSYWTYYNQGSRSKDELWMTRSIDILLQLAYITIPVMEVYYFHLRTQGISKPNIKNFTAICDQAFNLAQELTDHEAEGFKLVNSAAQTVKETVHLEDFINDMKSSDKIVKNKKAGLIYFEDTAFRDPDRHLDLLIKHAVSVKRDHFIKEANIII